MPTASVGVGLVAAALPEGIEVVVPDDEFTSVLFPLLVAEQERRVRLRRVAVRRSGRRRSGRETGLVAFSLTRSQDGETAAARRHRGGGAPARGASCWSMPRTPFRSCRSSPGSRRSTTSSATATSICSARAGWRFSIVRRDRWDESTPWFANWRTGATALRASYGGIARRSGDGRPALRCLARLARLGRGRAVARAAGRVAGAGLLDEVQALARRLAAGVGRPEPSASIVSLRVEDAEAAERALAEMGVRCAARGGNIRLSPHVYNTDADIDRAIEALRRFVD